MKRVGIHYVIPIIILVITISNIVLAQHTLKVFVFGIRGCENCDKMYETLVNIVGPEKVIFYDISTANLTRRRELVYALYSIQKLLSLNLSHDSPLITGIFVNNRLRIILLDYISEEECRNILEHPPKEGVLVVRNTRREVIVNKSLEIRLAELFTNPESSLRVTVKKREENLYSVIPIILTCAIIDSVNPCTFAVFTGLLLTTLYSIGRKRMMLTGISFILGVYLSYFLVGLNLVRVLAIYSLKYIIAYLALIMSAYLLFIGVKGDSPCPLPSPIRTILMKLFRSKTASTTSTFLMGMVVAVSLLPCTSGPYLIMLTLIGDIPFLTTLLILLIYNLIFIVPLLAILISTAVLHGIIKSIKIKRIEYTRLLNIIEGILLGILALYVLYLK